MDQNTSASDGGGGGAGNEIHAQHKLIDDVLGVVFSYVPILSAARMSGVSRGFKDMWKSNRYIVFDHSLVGEMDELKVMELVEKVMDSHEGPKIDKFSVRVSEITNDLVHWIEMAAAKNVEEIVLDYWPSPHPLPLFASLFTADSVKCLKLIHAEIESWPLDSIMPHLYTMKNLRELRLWNCDVGYFEKVCPSCIHLEHLEIIRCVNTCELDIIHSKLRILKVGGCEDLDYLTINAPNLKAFYFHGCAEMISAEHCYLKRACIRFVPDSRYVPGCLDQTDPLEPSAASLKVLTTNSLFLKAVCPDFPPSDWAAGRILFPNLTELHVYMEAFTYRTVVRLFDLLKRCPRVETLHIDLTRCRRYGISLTMAWRRKIALYTYGDAHGFQHLKAVKIKGFTASQDELDLVEYLVVRSVALERVALVSSQGSSIRLRPKLEISMYNFDDDQSCIYPTHTKSWYTE